MGGQPAAFAVEIAVANCKAMIMPLAHERLDALAQRRELDRRGAQFAFHRVDVQARAVIDGEGTLT